VFRAGQIPKKSLFCCGTEMIHTTDFFQKEAQECRRLAAQAMGKNDREYWLRLAQRWELLAQQDDSPKLESTRPRSTLEKRFAS
jgi:hypothetical protein